MQITNTIRHNGLYAYTFQGNSKDIEAEEKNSGHQVPFYYLAKLSDILMVVDPTMVSREISVSVL